MFSVNNDTTTLTFGIIQPTWGTTVVAGGKCNVLAQDSGQEVLRTNNELIIPVDASGQVKSIFNAVTAGSFNVWTMGWIDTTL